MVIIMTIDQLDVSGGPLAAWPLFAGKPNVSGLRVITVDARLPNVSLKYLTERLAEYQDWINWNFYLLSMGEAFDVGRRLVEKFAERAGPWSFVESNTAIPVGIEVARGRAGGTPRDAWWGASRMDGSKDFFQAFSYESTSRSLVLATPYDGAAEWFSEVVRDALDRSRDRNPEQSSLLISGVEFLREGDLLMGHSRHLDHRQGLDIISSTKTAPTLADDLRHFLSP